MDQDRNDQRKKGAVDRVNDVADKARQIKGLVDKARMAYQAGQAAAAAIASAPAWPFIAAGVAILIIFILVLTQGGGGSASFDSSGEDTGVLLPPGGGLPGSGSFASCPVANGSITTPSYQADSVGGHCGDNYPASCLSNSRRAKSIDVNTGGPSGESVVLPSLEGKIQQWIYVNRLPNILSDCTDPVDGTCGSTMIFLVNLGDQKNWTLHLVHMAASSLQLGKIYPSGTVVGKTSATHVHITLGIDIRNPILPPRGGTDTEAGWIAVDNEFGMCTPPKSSSGGVCEQGVGYCSASYLQNYFTDPVVAGKFSIVCEQESGGQIRAFNRKCAHPEISERSVDWSGGLMQINLLAHWITDKNGERLNCYTAFRKDNVLNDPTCADNVLNPPPHCMYPQEQNLENPAILPCHVANQDLVNRCEEAVLDPQTNLQKAVSLYNEQGFTPWAGAAACNVQ